MRQTENKGYNLIDQADEILETWEAVDENFEKIDNDITRTEKSIDLLKDNYEAKTSENSNNMDITDAINYYNQGNIKIGDGPELKQTITSGKNLLNTKGGFTKAYISNTGVVTGDPKNALFDGYISVQANSNYTFSANDSIKATNISYFDSSQNFISRDKIENQSSATVTTPANTEYVRINVQYDNNSMNQTIIDSLDIMFEAGSTATSYEPYTGGQITPSPTYEQPITVVEGESTIVANNKNVLALGSYSSSTISSNYDENTGKLSFSGTTATARWYKLTPTINQPIKAGQYTFSRDASKDYGLQLRCTLKDGSSKNIAISANETNVTDTFIDDVVSYELWGYLAISTQYNETIKVQLELGSINSSIITHKGKIFPLTLPEGMFLGKIGTTSNYIYGTKDNWKLHTELSKAILSTSSNVTYRDAQDGISRFRVNSVFNKYSSSPNDCLSSNFILDKRDSLYEEHFYVSSSGNVLIFIDANTASTTDALKSWFGTNSPVFYAPLSTPTDTDITDSTLVKQLNNIADNLRTYKGGTMVFTASDNLEPNIQFDYLKNPLSSIEARLELLEG